MAIRAQGDHAESDPSFERYARLVRRIVDVPVALVTFVEEDRQVFPGADGLPEPVQTTRETPLSHSFCQYVVKDEAPLIVSDARDDARLRDNLAIEDLGVIAYAGFPLRDGGGTVIGSLCAIDIKPRMWRQGELDTLADLAEACSAELAQREFRRRAELATASATAVSRRASTLLMLSEGLSDTHTVDDIAAAASRAAEIGLGCDHAGMWLLDRDDILVHTQDPGRSAPQAEGLEEVPMDASTILGTALVERNSHFYESLEELATDRPEVLAIASTEGGARAILPLRSGASALGTLALTWSEPREFTDDDRVTIAALTAYTAHAVHRANLLNDRVDVAQTLQRAMLTELPQPDHLELAARYRPASSSDDVGGDWYDAVVMPDGMTTLMIGDVVGHDIHAAATMGQLRSMLRAIAWATRDTPSASVARLDRAIVDLGMSALATLVFAHIEQTPQEDAAGFRHLVWTNAGHLPPLLIERDGRVGFLDDGASADVFLGVAPERPRRDQRVLVPSGSTLLLYTDGLIEQRGESLDEGLARLLQVAQLHHARPLEDFLDGVIDDLAGHHPGDDVAVMAVRFHPEHP